MAAGNRKHASIEARSSILKPWASWWLMSDVIRREDSQGFLSVSVYRRISVNMEPGQQVMGHLNSRVFP